MSGSPKSSALISACLHAGAIVLIVSVTSVPSKIAVHLPDRRFTPLVLPQYRALVPRPHDGGGGGGQHDLTPARFGQLPRLATHEFVAPTTHPPRSEAQIMIEPALLAADPPLNQAKIDISLLGSPSGVHFGDSGGRGDGGGIGDGHHGGVGDHSGPGSGPKDGEGVGWSGGPGGGGSGKITAPVLLWKTEPEYSEEARRAKYQGTVVLRIEIDQQGKPCNAKVLQSLGLGLDERAVDTVMKWKFKAAMQDGKPVVSVATIEVSFRLL